MKIKKNAFTLIELLAVIVILAIIALIATPIILGIINDSKKSAAELSVKNYLRAVEIAVSNEQMKNQINTENLNCEIENNGKEINCGTGDSIIVEYNGEGLISGTIVLEKGTVVQITDGEIGEWNVTLFEGEINLDKEQKEEIKEEEKEEIKVSLVTGQEFNAKIKTLANATSMSYSTDDTTVISIEFYSNGLLSKEKKEYLEGLGDSNKVDVSLNSDGSIIAYYDNGKVYIVSDNLISFNSISTHMFYKLCNVSSISFAKIDTSSVTTMENMFYNCKSLTNLNLSSFDTSQVKSMKWMFQNCESLVTLDISNFDTSQVTEVYRMFHNCISLTNINISNFNTSKLTNLADMFYNCKSLTNLDLSSFDTSSVTTMENMFYNCKSLTNLDLSSFDTSQVTSMKWMFQYCESLVTLDISNFDTNQVTDMYRMFQGTANLTKIIIGCKWKTAEKTTDMFYNSAYTLDKLNALVEEIKPTCPVANE